MSSESDSSGSTSSSSNSTVYSSGNGQLIIPGGRSETVSKDQTITISVPTGASKTSMKIIIEQVLDTVELIDSAEELLTPIYEVSNSYDGDLTKLLTLSFQLDPETLGEHPTPSIYSYDEEQQVWVQIGGELDGDEISVEVDHFGTFAVFAEMEEAVDQIDLTPESSFLDTQGHWAEEAIEKAASLGIVHGYDDGTFQPDLAVTRAEFTYLLMNILKPQTEGEMLSFSDAENIGAWSKQAIALQ